ncbi:MAG: site-specific integrase, partial [Thermoleophilaceae bacterium]|nr:site-specific integrase [Thermoleophilaceae bacterium]
MSETANRDLTVDTAYQELLSEFLAYLEFEARCSKNTLIAYRTDTLQFGAYIKAHGVDVLKVDQQHVIDYLEILAETGTIASTTLHRKLSSLRSFYLHLRREGYIRFDPTADVRAPTQVKKLPWVLSRDEVQHFLASVQGSTPMAQRDRALLELM